MRKLWLAAKTSIHPIESLRHLREGLIQQGRTNLSGCSFVELFVKHPADGLGLSLYLVAPPPIGVEHAAQHGAKPRSSILPVRRKVRAAEEHLSVRSEEGRQRPSSLLGEHLHRALVPRVHVGPLVPVDLDADKVLVEERGDLRVFVRLPVHHVAPVAPHGSYVE
jgi:hypothetical protein